MISKYFEYKEENWINLIKAGETSFVQYKEKIVSSDSLSSEIVAFCNSYGGIILIGIRDKDCEILGLDYNEIQKYSQLCANVATNNVIPGVLIKTEVITVLNKNLLVVYIDEGIHKPYKDSNHIVWVKQGADKRKIIDNYELLRLFQKGGIFVPDEQEIYEAGKDELNLNLFDRYIEKAFEVPRNEIDIPLDVLLNNSGIMKNNRFTLGGLMFFGNNPQKYKPAFNIKAVSFYGNDIEGEEYRDSEDISGSIIEMFEKGMAFFKRNLKKIQKGQNFNSLGIIEVSIVSLEEILQNALIHRDYLKNAPIRIFIFDNRIEIISPGKLPNSLTVENLLFGNCMIRNPLLASYCVKLMQYRGLGSGIRRALKNEPEMKLINDVSGEQFIVSFKRPV